MEKYRPTLFLLIIAVIQLTNGQSRLSPENITPEERQFRVAYEWNTIDFSFGSDQAKNNAIFTGDYIPQNNIISDVKAFQKRLYLTVPRMLPGVPATLGYVISPDNNGPTDPGIEAYPSWEMNKQGNCSAFQFVQGIAIDAAGVMWVIDSGRSETLVPGPPKFLCNPKLILLDLKQNGRIIHRYEFPPEVVARGTNYLNKVVVDDAFGGYAYITDNSGADPGIVVYSRKLNRSWKVRENNSMRAAQNAVAFAVNGTNLNFSIHIDGIALGPYFNPNFATGIAATATGLPSDNFERNVYYCPLSSYHLYSMPASVLRDPEFALRASPVQVLESVTDHGLKISQTDGMIMDNHGNLYYSLLKEHAIAQWDSYKPFTIENQRIIARDDSYIQWVDGMGFDEDGYLYVVMNRLHNFVAGRLNPNEVNFRILKSRTGSLSYVYSNNKNFDPLLDDNSGGLNNGVYIHENGFSGFDNGLGGGISSTTPVFSSQFGGVGRGYRNSAVRQGSFVGLTLILALVLGIFLK